MQLSSLLGTMVVDAGRHPVGTVIDVRLTVPAGRGSEPEVLGFVVSPHTRSSYLGFERTGTNAPALIAAMARWRHRGTFLAGWADVARIGTERITLRPGYTRRSAAL
ncbi:MAG: hypothetical protein HYZ39_06470 [Mycolicibacterium cosmeticum]|nr:hypothetical protein [Mycolicibacterium cosmeticum]